MQVKNLMKKYCYKNDDNTLEDDGFETYFSKDTHLITIEETNERIESFQITDEDEDIVTIMLEGESTFQAELTEDIGAAVYKRVS